MKSAGVVLQVDIPAGVGAVGEWDDKPIWLLHHADRGGVATAAAAAPPDYFIVLPQARHSNGWRVLAGRECGFAEIQCAPEQYVVHKHATNVF